jgi:hypothetical protein
LNNIDRFPENNDELIEAINFLNKKCYEDFIAYLKFKYPNTEISRHPNIETSKYPSDYSCNYHQCADSNISTKEEYEEITILNEEEKNMLINKYQIGNGYKNNKTSDPHDILSILVNPDIFKMLCIIFKQTSQYSDPNMIVFDEILDHDQVQKMIQQYQNLSPPSLTMKYDNNECDEKIEGIYVTDGIEKNKNSPISKEGTHLVNQNSNEKDLGDIIEKNIDTQNVEKSTKIDLSNLNNEKLLLIKKRLEELSVLRSKYLNENNHKMIEEINKEKDEILKATIEYKKKMENLVDSKVKIPGQLASSRFEDEKNVEYLDLQFDPTNDHNDLKNIKIEFKDDNRIKEIILVDYYLPFNENNITRFNNQFNIYFDNKLYRIIIPPGKYNLNTLFSYIKDQVNFLDFIVDDNGIVTIKNIHNSNFDLLTDGDTIFPVLGFIDRSDEYRGRNTYIAKETYDLNCNEKVLFSLSGSTMDPFPLEFNQCVTSNKCLKKSSTSAGVVMKKMILKFTNVLGQYYDFVLPFKMCFKIVYAE